MFATWVYLSHIIQYTFPRTVFNKLLKTELEFGMIYKFTFWMLREINFPYLFSGPSFSSGKDFDLNINNVVILMTLTHCRIATSWIVADLWHLLTWCSSNYSNAFFQFQKSLSRKASSLLHSVERVPFIFCFLQIKQVTVSLTML